jgi:hypothetical protein
MIGRRPGSLLALTAMYVSIAGMDASAQTSPAPRATAATGTFAASISCSLSARVSELDEAHTRYAVSFRAFETGPVSGTVALWAKDRRYDVPFRNVVALDSRDRISPETSITVHFAAPTALDGAVVTAIADGSGQRPCDPWYSPWVVSPRPGPDGRSAEVRTIDERFLVHARNAAAIDAPAAIPDPLSCPTPYRAGRTVRAIDATPQGPGSGVSVVMVLLDASDKIVNARIERSAGLVWLDAAALKAVRASEFQGQIFRCRHVTGAYLFSVEFLPDAR